MNEQAESPPNIAFIAVALEGGLAIVALALGLLLNHSPLETVEFSTEALGANVAAVGWGLAAALPMILALLAMDRWPLPWLDNLQEVVEKQVVPLFAHSTWVELAIISAAAGIGEEMLFRGLAQLAIADWYGGWWGVWIGLAAASILFGVCHWVTRMYAVLATLVGVYLGWLLLATDNLLAPIVAHAVYDFFALIFLVKWKKVARDASEEA